MPRVGRPETVEFSPRLLVSIDSAHPLEILAVAGLGESHLFCPMPTGQPLTRSAEQEHQIH